MANKKIAANMGAGHEVLELERGGEKLWRVSPETAWRKVEQAALEYYSRDGWRGYSGEGGLMLNLIKAAAMRKLPAIHRIRFTEALFVIAAETNTPDYLDTLPKGHRSVRQLLSNIQSSDVRQIVRVFRSMIGQDEAKYSWRNFFARRQTRRQNAAVHPFFPDLEEWHLVELYENLGKDRLYHIARAFSEDPYEYRKGWPDLTLWRGGEVVFKEIKAPGDHIHSSQRKTIRDILLPLDYEVSIVDIIDANSSS